MHLVHLVSRIPTFFFKLPTLIIWITNYYYTNDCSASFYYLNSNPILIQGFKRHFQLNSEWWTIAWCGCKATSEDTIKSMAFNKDVAFYLYTWFQLVLSRKVEGRTALLFSLEILSFVQCICTFLKKTALSHLAVRKFWNMTPHPCRTPSKQRCVRCKDRILWAENGLKGAETRRLLLAHICVLWETAHFCYFSPV